MSAVLSGANELSLAASVGIGIALTAVAGLLVLVRIKSNWRAGTIEHVGDVVSVIALGFIAGTIAGQWKIITKTSDPTVSLDSLILLNYAVVWVGSIAMWSSKVPLLLLYVQLFGIKRWVKMVCYTIICATAIIFLTFASLTTKKCNPGSGTVDVLFLLACSQQAADSGFALGMTSVLTDGLIFVIPIPLILHLKLSTRSKVGLLFVFSGGLLGIVASAISANYKWRSKQGESGGTTGAMICTIVDCAVGLAVGCVPAVYGFWSRTVVPSAFYSRISSLSKRSLVRSGRSNGSATTKAHTKPPSRGSSEHINHSQIQKSDAPHELQTNMPPVPPVQYSQYSHGNMV